MALGRAGWRGKSEVAAQKNARRKKRAETAQGDPGRRDGEGATKKKKKKKDQEYNCDFCLLGKKLRKIAGSGGLVGHGNHAG